MKVIVGIVVIFISLPGLCQEMGRSKIDSLVNVINQSSYSSASDSLYQKDSATHAIIKTVVTIWRDSRDLKKYLHKERSVTWENNTPVATFSESFFFFHGGQLIKVEETINRAGEESKNEYYFWGNQFIPPGNVTSKETQRAAFLLSVSYSVRKEVADAYK